MDRAGDIKNYFKTNRIFQVNGEWYFTTREGEDKGPFASKADAEVQIALYIRRILEIENRGGKVSSQSDEENP